MRIVPEVSFHAMGSQELGALPSTLISSSQRAHADPCLPQSSPALPNQNIDVPMSLCSLLCLLVLLSISLEKPGRSERCRPSPRSDISLCGVVLQQADPAWSRNLEMRYAK